MFFDERRNLFVTQVTAFFQWCNYLTDQVTAIGKEPLYVNLDETPIPVCFTHVRGNVIRTVRLGAARQPATRSDTRLYFTLVALICTEPALQPLLPQVILVSDKALRAQDEAAVQASLPDKRIPLVANIGMEQQGDAGRDRYPR